MSYLTPNYVEHSVCGKKKRFYPVSVLKAFKMRRVGKPLAQALSVLFASRKHDHSEQVEQVVTEEQTMTVTSLSAVSPEMASMRAKQQAEALAEAIDALTDDENVLVLAELIINSLREEWEEGQAPPAKEFLSSLDTLSMRDMIWGLAKANAEVFGPFKEVFASRVAGALSEDLAEVISQKETVGAS